MTEDIDIIHSPLQQTYDADGHSVQIQIYRSADSQWILEVVDEHGTSTVWDDLFKTDKDALEEAFKVIEVEGIGSFIINAQSKAKAAEPELLRSIAQSIQPADQEMQDMMAPLTEDELDELDQFLLYGVENDDGMTLDALDGYLHAIAIGPQTIMPSQWLPKVWGDGSAMMPPMDNINNQLNHIMGLIMRHYNSIISGFEQTPALVVPCWNSHENDIGEFENAEIWAYGFSEGVQLIRDAWKPLFDTPQGQQWYRPIGLLGEDEFSDDQDRLTRTPQQREELTQQIETSLVNIHAFWAPLRKAIYERELSKQLRIKVGRNEPCLCGSGKKFKKCCGLAAELH